MTSDERVEKSAVLLLSAAARCHPLPTPGGRPVMCLVASLELTMVRSVIPGVLTVWLLNTKDALHRDASHRENETRWHAATFHMRHSIPAERYAPRPHCVPPASQAYSFVRQTVGYHPNLLPPSYRST